VVSKRAIRSSAAWLCLCAAVSIGGCGKEKATPPPPPPPPKPPFEAPPYAQYLKGMKICLDPGHGGETHGKNYKRGPTGLREAEVNLRVAHFLREFLETSGAKVFMTRREDVALSEDDTEDQHLRADMANQNGCDLFFSIHHNANDANPNANFTSVWYHDDPDHSPASLDVAQCLAIAVSDELRLPQQLGCPLMSDLLMFPKSGFGVLRRARVPAILCEASFHSNRDEEARLRDPQYNRREAYSMFVGLARYAYGGIPRMKIVEPADGVVPDNGTLDPVIELDDGIRGRKSWGWDKPMILRDSIIVRQGGKRLPFTFDEQSNQLKVQLPKKLPIGALQLEVRFENLFKHSNPGNLLDLKVAKKATPRQPSTRPVVTEDQGVIIPGSP
jgi:N-acetylmuramoyl-L-alanine amidase